MGGSDGAGPFISVGTNILRYGIPLLIVFLYAGRPLRYGLGIAAVLLASGIYTWANDNTTIFVDRSYFSIIRVNQQQEKFGEQLSKYTTLMHATTNHGMTSPSRRSSGDWRQPTTIVPRRLAM